MLTCPLCRSGSLFAVLNVCRESYASYPFRECLDCDTSDRTYRSIPGPVVADRSSARVGIQTHFASRATFGVRFHCSRCRCAIWRNPAPGGTDGEQRWKASPMYPIHCSTNIAAAGIPIHRGWHEGVVTAHNIGGDPATIASCRGRRPNGNGNA